MTVCQKRDTDLAQLRQYHKISKMRSVFFDKCGISDKYEKIAKVWETVGKRSQKARGESKLWHGVCIIHKHAVGITCLQ